MHEVTEIVYDCFDDESIKRYKNSGKQSVYSAIGNAVKRKLPDYKEELKNPKIVKILGEIISNGVLDDIVDEQERLIEAQKEILDDIQTKKANSYNSYTGYVRLQREYEEKYVGLERECKQLEQRLEVLKDKSQAESVKDARLCGAMQAYDFILGKTGKQELACKAFNSYLIGYGEDAREYETKGETKRNEKRL